MPPFGRRDHEKSALVAASKARFTASAMTPIRLHDAGISTPPPRQSTVRRVLCHPARCASHAQRRDNYAKRGGLGAARRLRAFIMRYRGHAWLRAARPRWAG